MIRQIFSKTMLTILLAFFAAGGACYPPTKTVSSEEMHAAHIFTSYRIEDRTSDDGKCRRRITTQFSGDNKIYQLQPPSRATYNGAEISGEFDCEADRAEFVLTDSQGGTKRDVYETRKVKLDFPAEIERARDLRVPIEFDDQYDYEFEGRIDPKNGDAGNASLKVQRLRDEAELGERLSAPNVPQNISYILHREKLLVIPTAILSPIAPGDATVNIDVALNIFKPRSKSPESSLKSVAFSFKYSLKTESRLK